MPYVTAKSKGSVQWIERYMIDRSINQKIDRWTTGWMTKYRIGVQISSLISKSLLFPYFGKWARQVDFQIMCRDCTCLSLEDQFPSSDIRTTGVWPGPFRVHEK